MPDLRFNAPPHHVLVVDGESIPGGEARPVSAEAAERALADPSIDVSLPAFGPEPKPRPKRSRRKTTGDDAGESDG